MKKYSFESSFYTCRYFWCFDWMKFGQCWNHVAFAETPDPHMLWLMWTALFRGGNKIKHNINCTCFELDIDIKAEWIYFFIAPKCFALGIHNWDLLARQWWQLLHCALSTSGDYCTHVCCFVRCNPSFDFFHISEVLEVKFWLYFSFLCLFWKPCWKSHKLLWTLYLVLVTKAIYGSKRELGTRKVLCQSWGLFWSRSVQNCFKRALAGLQMI